jgi:hypothetical protein
VLDVLDAHVCGTAEEDGERVLRVLDVVDLDAAPVGVAPYLCRGVDQQRDVIQERPLRLGLGAVRRSSARGRLRPARRPAAEAHALELAHVRAAAERRGRDRIRASSLDEHDQKPAPFSSFWGACRARGGTT